jgi:hypothetical protein
MIENIEKKRVWNNQLRLELPIFIGVVKGSFVLRMYGLLSKADFKCEYMNGMAM